MTSYKDTENKIVGRLLRTPLRSISMHQIAIDTGLTYVTVHKIIPILFQRKLIKIEKKGKNNLISIDFENSRTEDLTSAIIDEKTILIKKHPKIFVLIKDIEQALVGKFFILLLFGSYAKEKEKKNSDIDLLFILPERKSIEEYKEKIDKVMKLTTLKKDINLVSTDDFIEMLNQKYSVGREAFEEGIVLFGAEHFYMMVKEYVGKKGY
jgi:predicted nucleotidyltransferase